MQTYTFYRKEEKEKGKKLLKSLFYCIFAKDKLHLGKATKQACFFAEASSKNIFAKHKTSHLKDGGHSMNNLTIIIKTVVLTALLHMVAPHATAWGLSPVMVGPERNSQMVLHEDCLNTDDYDDDDENVNITVDKDDLDGTEGDGTGEDGGTDGTGKGNGTGGNGSGGNGTGSDAPDQQEEQLFVRVNDASQLADGDVVVIGNAANHALMSTQEEKKRRKAISATFDEDGRPTVPDGAQLITLSRRSKGWMLKVDDTHCLAATNSSTQELKTVTTSSKELTTAKIDIDPLTGDAQIEFNGSRANNTCLRFSSTSSVGFFQCYSSPYSVKPVQIYRRVLRVGPLHLYADPSSESEVDDNATQLSRANGHLAESITLHRTFCADGGWYTLCLPFALTPSDIATTLQGAVVERLSSAGRAEDGAPLLSFKRTDAVAAGQPFIMKPSATLTDPVFSSRDIVANEPTPVTKTIAASATHGQTDIQMCGTYVPTPLLGTAYRFLNSSGTRLSVPNGEGELKPFRAFFVFSDYADAAAAVVNHIDDSTPSAISTPFAGGKTIGSETIGSKTTGASNKEKATSVYDLLGRKVNKTQPSHSPRIVIMNGRKTVERSR